MPTSGLLVVSLYKAPKGWSYCRVQIRRRESLSRESRDTYVVMHGEEGGVPVCYSPISQAGVDFNIVHLEEEKVLSKVKGIKSFLLYTWW